MSIMETIIDIPADHERNIFGQFDAFVKIIEKTLNVTIIARNDEIKVIGSGDNVSKAKNVFMQLLELSKEAIP